VSGSLQVARAALRNRALRATLVAFVFFSVAEWTRWVALLVFGFDRGGAAGSGLIAVIQLVPAAILTPFTSSLADRFHRPRVLLGGYLVAAFGTAAGGIAIVVDASFVVVAILSALGLCGVTLIRPTQASLLPRLVSTPAELTAANAIVSFVVGGSILAGPALAAALMAVWSPSATLIVAGALLAVGALTIAFIYRGSAEAAGPGEPVDLLGGFRQVARNPGAGFVLLLLGLQAITWGAVDVLIVGLAIDQLDLGRSGAGLLAAAVGVGGVMGGAATVSLVGRSRLTPGFAFGVALWGIPLVAIAIVLAPVPVIAFLAIAGVGYAFMDVSGRTLLQRAVDERTLGRVFGLLEAGFMAAWAIGSAIAPIALAALTLRWTFVALGLALPLVTALSWSRLRRIDAQAWVPSRELELLRSIDIFGPLRGPVLERLARSTREVDVPAGRTFIREGEPGDRFYAIVDGEVRVTAGGQEIARLGPGGYVGEIALLRDVPRQASVTATTDTRLLSLDREPFLEAVTGSRGAAAVAHGGIEQRLAELEPRDRT
jgi:MFS family permease